MTKATPVEQQVLAQKLARYDQLGEMLAKIDLDIAELNGSRVALQGERETIGETLAEGATTDAELIRWSWTTPGMQKLTRTLVELHPSIAGFNQWKRTKRQGDDGDVWLMPELDMLYADRVDKSVEDLAAALVEFARRFVAEPVPADAHSSRIRWVRTEDMPPGRIPVYVLPMGKNDQHRWSIEFDPATQVAMLTDDDGTVRPYAGTLAEVIVKTSRHMFDID